MQSTMRRLVLAVWATQFFAGRPAMAEAFTLRRTQVAAGIDYGLYVGEAADVVPSPYGLGLGARAGYTFGPGVYVGAEGHYFFGVSRHFPEYGDVEGSLGIAHAGIEAGYDFALGHDLMLRPAIGAGAARVTAKVRVEGLDGTVTETGWVFTAGLVSSYAIDPVFVGAEARYTALGISTEPLQDIPGFDVDENARLDGLLFGLRVGMAF